LRTTVISISNRACRVTFLALLAPAVCLLVACGNGSTLTQTATTENVSTQASVYALTGSAAELPAAYNMEGATFVRPVLQPNGTVNFQLAFDINADGKVVLLPVRKVTPQPPFPPSGAPSIGLVRSTIPYDQITKAATSGYAFDSVTIASVGEAFYLQLPLAGCVYGEPYYGKLVIDSVFVAERRIVARALTNRNCGGYRSLTTGLPKN
jgi:hypothetical protein